ncbi:MAG: NERD domain-containing protein, partial [Streptomycetaceae bacterium]|nr:NERD domain-containing protein [Streptomycetaceae bacterium]
LVVTPWKRYGHDRLYVNEGPGGARVAWFDRRTGELTVEVEDLRAQVLEALRPYLDDIGGTDDTAQPAVPPRPRTAPLSPAHDLAANRPGQAVAEHAAELSPRPWLRRLARLFRIRTAATSWEVGAAGERVVAGALADLEGRGWYVLQSVRLPGGADNDHVVIGPGGVFTVNTKHHRKARIWVGDEMAKVNGTKAPYPPKSRAEAARASRVLSAAYGRHVPVQPVLAFVRPGRITDGQTGAPQRRVVVADGQMLAFVLGGLPTKLDRATVDAVYAVARDARTWLDPQESRRY